LTKENWRATSDNIMRLILARSNVDLAGNFQEIVVVPDAFLWFLPFEVLHVGGREDQRMLISQARVRYAPTVGLAVPEPHTQKQQPNVGVVLGKLYPQDDTAVATQAFEQFGRAVPGAAALPNPLPTASRTFRVALDTLIVLDDIEPASGPYDWSPVQIDRGKPGASLADWLLLPWGGPQHVILPGFHTSAESGLRKTSDTGDDLFLSLCGLMGSGARTVLMSRWRIAGRTSFDLVREFAQELPHTSPADAWQRSVQLSMDTQIEPEYEPRVRDGIGAGEPLNADHPFFWAGYMLVDSGTTHSGAATALAAPPQDPSANDVDGLLPMGLAQPAADAPVDDAPPAVNRRRAK